MTNNRPTSDNTTAPDSIRMPAEWEQQDAIMLVWPHRHTDWAYMLEEVRKCFSDIIQAINRAGEKVILIVPEDEEPELPATLDHKMTRTVPCPTNDTWARDTCAITTVRNGDLVVNDFKFNGWGLKFAADLDNLLTGNLFDGGLFDAHYANRLGFVLEGGSIESDGNGILMTTEECLLSKNRNGGHDKARIEEELKSIFGAKKILWLQHGALEGDDTDSHIDTLARLAPDETILYTGTDRTDDSHYEGLKQMEHELKQFTTLGGHKFRLVRLPLPSPIFDEEGNRLPATYANFLIGNGFVLVPTYNQPEYDRAALESISSAFPRHEVIGVDCNALIKQHGSLHCVTMQFPKNSINL